VGKKPLLLNRGGGGKRKEVHLFKTKITLREIGKRKEPLNPFICLKKGEGRRGGRSAAESMEIIARQRAKGGEKMDIVITSIEDW